MGYLIYISTAFLWAVFALHMQKRICSDPTIGKYILCFCQNFLFCPIALTIAILKFDKHSKKIADVNL